MAKKRKTRPLTVRCARCAWTRTGRQAAMLAAQRAHRRVHVSTATEGRP